MARIFLIFFLALCAISNAQTPNYLFFDDSNGLFDFEQYSLCQDKQKYVWIAGNSGVFKYNGVEFKSHQANLSSSRSLTNLRCDNYNRIWCHDFFGNIYIVVNGKLELFKLWNNKQSATFPVFEIFNDKLWVIYDEGINCYSIPRETSSFKLLKSIKIPNAKSARFFKEKLFFSSLNSVISIDSDFKITNHQIQGQHLTDFLKAWSSYFELNGDLYLLSRQEKTLYKFSGNKFEKYKQFNSLPDIITCKTVNQNVWVLTRSGAYCYDEKFNLNKLIFKYVPISDVLIDHENNYWFSTLTKGVFLVPNLNSSIYKTPSQQGFTKLMVHQNKLIAGSTDGNLYTLINDSLVVLTNFKNTKEVSFLSSIDNDLYFGNINFFKLNYRNEIINLGVNPPFKQVNKIDNNTLLVADPSGLYYYSFNNWKTDNQVFLEWTKEFTKDVPILVDNKVIRINKNLISERTNKFFVHDSFILASSKNGTYLVTKKGKQLQNIKGKIIYSNDFTYNDTCVFIATSSSGVLTYKKYKWQTFDSLNSKIHSVYIQKIKLVRDDIWLATDDGIIKYNLKSGYLTHFGKEAGLITYKINDLCNFNGKMFVASSKGLMTFPLADINQSRVNPPVILSSVVCDGDTILFSDTLVTIQPNSRIISFKFDVLAYNAPETFVLRYKREGSDFVYLNKQNYQVILNQLNPGDNKVLIELFDKQLNRTVYAKQFIVIMEFAFYQSWYFKFLLMVLFGLVIFLIIKRRMEIIKRKNKELIEKERILTELKQSMLTSIKAQMNPHFIFNALNTIQSYVLKNDKMQANFYLGKFSDLIRKILQMSSKDSVSVREEIEALELYLDLENMRLNKELKFSILDDEITDLLSKKIPSMIIQPYVENAIKHGLMHKKENKYLEIKFYKLTKQSLKVVITDNGIGRAAAEKIKQRNSAFHQSFSSEANKKRLELLNTQNSNTIGVTYEDLYDNMMLPIGTKVTIHIPIS